MSRFIANAVASVACPPLLVICITEEQAGWCKQYSEEGYNVIHVPYPPKTEESFKKDLQEAGATFLEQTQSADWALITFGMQDKHFKQVVYNFQHETREVKAIVHYCPAVENAADILIKASHGVYIPTLFHLSTTQDHLAASLIAAADAGSVGYDVLPASQPPVTVYTYPRVPAQPPFPFGMKAPALVVAGEKSAADPYTRSAVSLSYSRTLDLLKKLLGPRYDLEKLWEKHTYYEFVERDFRKTMSTMVATPYVNHISTLTGGVGYDDLARFYKYHFTRDNVTPPDTELITVSRTVGADRIVDEMIFKCTHTTEIDYFLPGVKPTGKPLELVVVGIISFRGDKLFFEHIYWDQASALVQLGLLETKGLPIAGVEVAHKVLDPFGVESNKLMAKWKESEGLPID